MANEDGIQVSRTPIIDAKLDRLYNNTKQKRVTLASARKERQFSPDSLPSKEEYFHALNPNASESDLHYYRIKSRIQAENDQIQANQAAEAELNRDRTNQERLKDVAITLGGKAPIALGSSIYHAADLLSDVMTAGVPSAGTLGSLGIGVPDRETQKFKTLDEAVEDVTGISGSEAIAKTQKALGELQSDPLQYDRAKVAQLSHARRAEQEKLGVKDESLAVRTAFEVSNFINSAADYIDNPALAIDAALESAPQMLIPGALASKSIKELSKRKGKAYLATKAGKAEVNSIATRAGVSYSTFSEGLSNGGQVHAKVLGTSFDQLEKDSPEYNKLIEQGISPKKARRILANKARNITVAIAGTVGGLTSWGLGTGKLEGKFFKAGSGLDKAFVKGITKGVVSEGVEETIQGAAGKLAENVGIQQTIKDKQDLLEGTGEAAGAGLVTGALSGGTIGGVSNVNIRPLTKGTEKVIEAVREKTTPNIVKEAVKSKDLSKLKEPEHKLDAMLKDTILPKKGTPEYAPHVAELQDQLSNYYTKLVKQMKAHQANNTDPTATDEGFKEYAYFKQAIGALKATDTVVNVATTKTAVENVVKAKETTPEVTTDIDKVIRTFGSDSQSMSLEQGESLLATDKLNPQQRKAVETRVKILKTMDEVTNDIYHGKEDSKFEGIVSLVDRIGTAIEQGNTGRAKTIYNKLNNFRKGHVKKANDFKAALVGYNKLKAHSKAVLTPKEQSAIDHVNENYVGDSLQEGREVVGPGFDRLTNEVVREVEALNLSIEEVESKLGTKDITPPETIVEGATTPPVQETPSKKNRINRVGQALVDIVHNKYVKLKRPSKNTDPEYLAESQEIYNQLVIDSLEDVNFYQELVNDVFENSSMVGYLDKKGFTISSGYVGEAQQDKNSKKDKRLRDSISSKAFAMALSRVDEDVFKPMVEQLIKDFPTITIPLRVSEKRVTRVPHFTGGKVKYTGNNPEVLELLEDSFSETSESVAKGDTKVGAKSEPLKASLQRNITSGVYKDKARGVIAPPIRSKANEPKITKEEATEEVSGDKKTYTLEEDIATLTKADKLPKGIVGKDTTQLAKLNKKQLKALKQRAQAVRDAIAVEKVQEAKDYELSSYVITNGIGTTESKSKLTGKLKYPKLDNALKYFYNTLGKATSPLRTVKDLFNNIDKVEGLDDAQRGALGYGPEATTTNVVNFVSQFSETFNRTFVPKEAGFSFDDPINFLMKDDGSNMLSTEALDAMSITALQGVTDMVYATMYADKRKVNQLANNPDQESEPTSEQYELLTTAGDYWSFMANDLGKRAITAMGLKPNATTADELTVGSMQVSVGNHILGTLVKMKLVEQVTIDGKSAVEIGISEKKDVGDTNLQPDARQFVRILPQTNESGYLIANDKAQAYADLIRDSNSVLTKLSDMESKVIDPSFDVPEKAPTKIRGSKMQKVPKAQQEALLASSERPNTIYERNFKFIEQFRDLDKRQALYELQGFDSTYETEKHVNLHKSIEAKNQQIKKEIDSFFDFVTKVEKWNDGKERATEFYFSHYVSKNMRAGIDSNTVNPNTGKFTRFFLGLKSKEKIITTANTDQFLLAVAEGLDISVDNLSTSDSISQLYDSLDPTKWTEQKDIDKAQNLSDALSNIQSIDTTNMSQVLEAAKSLGMNAHGLVALIAYSDYLEANLTGKPFKTTLYREVDGKTNGVIIGLLQFMGAKGVTPQEKFAVLREMVARGGIFTDGTKNFSDYVETGQLDTYQNTASEWAKATDEFGSDYLTLDSDDLKELSKSKNKTESRLAKGAREFKKFKSDPIARLGAIQQLIGNFYNNETGGIEGFARNLAKPATMTTTYGESINSIIESFGQEMLQKTYDDLIEASGDKDKVTDILNAINTITGSEFKTDDGIVDIDFLMGKREEESLVKAIVDSYGAALGVSVESVFGEFIEQRTQINNAFKLMHEGFIQLYDKKVKEVIDKKMSNLKEGEWARPSLTQDEVDVINNELIESMPIFKSYFAKATEEGINPMKVVNSARDEDSLVTQSVFKGQISKHRTVYSLDSEGNLVIKNVQGTKTVNGSSTTKTWGEPGVGGAILGIHSIDSATMMQVIKEHAVLNIFDAIGVDVDGSLSATEALNKAFELAVFDYSIRESVNESLIRTMGILQESHPEIIKDLDTKLDIGLQPEVSFEDKKEFGIGFGSPDVKTYLKEYARDTDKLTKERAEFRKEITSIIQYTPGEGGGSKLRKFSDAETKETLTNVGSDIVKEVNDSLGSTPDSPIDTENFISYENTEISRTNSMKMFEELGVEGNVKDSDSHTTHLRGLLTGVINKVINPIMVNLGRSGSKTKGLINSEIYINSAISSGLLGFSTLMSSREVYVHEMFHAVTLNAFNQDSSLVNETKKIYNYVRKLKDSDGNLVIGPHTFMTKGVTFNDPSYFEELEAATNMYEYIFGSKITQHNAIGVDSISGQEIEMSFSNALPEFVTYAVTNENFMAELAKIHVSLKGKIIPKTKDKTVTSWLSELIENILNWFSAAITGTRKSNTADKKLYSLAVQLSEIEGKQEHQLQVKANKAYDYGSKAVNKSIAMIVQPLRNLVDKYTPPDDTIRSKVKNISKITLSGNVRMDGILDAIQDTRVRMNLAEDSLVGSLLSEVKGKDLTNRRYHDLRRLSNKLIDQTRHQIDNHIAAQFRDSFNEYTKDKGTTVTKGLLKTDLTTIALDKDGKLKYSATDLERLYSDSKFLESKITAINNRIDSGYDSEVATWFKSMSASLGKYMAIGIPIEKYLMMNADLIAGLHMTDLKVTYDLDKATALLDELATYHSIKHIGEKNKKDMATLIKEEFEVNKKENGIVFAMQLHRYNKQEALEKNFDGQKLIMQKGFTREIYNPNIDIITAPISHKKEMKARGYSTDGVPVKKDKDDPNQEVLVQYVNRYAASNDLMAGIVSYASNHAKGTNLVDIYQQQGQLTPALEAAFDKPAISRKKKKIIKNIIKGKATKHSMANGVLAPIFDSKGRVTEYRYLMSEFTKDKLLEKNNNAAQVMSGMVATVTGKVNTDIINEKLIQAAYDDFLVSGEKISPKKFTAIGPNVADPRYKEVYFMLPQSAKDNIRDIWGPSKTMYIRTEVAVLSFGQRKWSVTNLKKMSKENLGAYNAMKAMANNAATSALNNKVGRLTETVLTEGVKLVKDAIVIKSGGVLLGNVISNAILLKVLGVPAADIIKDHAKAIVYANRFQKHTKRLDELETLQKINKDKSKDKEIAREIKELKNSITINPVKELMDLGIHQSIIEDIGQEDDTYSYRTQLEEKLVKNKVSGAVIKATPDVVKTIGKNVLMTHDSATYKFMRDATQISDFASRYVLHKHNMKSAEGKPANEVNAIRRKSIDMIEDVFINYDLPTHKGVQYVNDIGVFMFSKFFIRIQKIIAHMAKHHPGSLLASLALQGLWFDIEDITDSLMTIEELFNKFNADLLGLFAEIWDAPFVSNQIL